MNKPFKPTLALLFTFTLVLLVSCSSDKEETKENAKSAVDEITAPVGEVAVAEAQSETEEPAAAPAPSGGKGKEIYDGVCFACHAQGLAGAPKLGDKEAWTARLEKGNDTLYDHSINGFTGESGSMMPPKGGRADIADDDIKAAVDYMIETAGGIVGGAPSAATTTDAEPVAAVGDSAKGKEVYDSACFVCHATGVAGAPKLGDTEAWAARISQGNDMLYDHAINGFMGAGLMPPKGGKTDLSDDDVKAAVDFMVTGSQ